MHIGISKFLSISGKSRHLVDLLVNDRASTAPHQRRLVDQQSLAGEIDRGDVAGAIVMDDGQHRDTTTRAVGTPSEATQGGCSRLRRLLLFSDMVNVPRYAIYYVAAPGSDLDRFGAQLLGYDAFSGEDRPVPDDITQALPDWPELTRDPRKYGFHVTLKAPLSLRQGKTERELLAACASFAKTPRRIPVIRPVVNSIGGFVAVVPAEPSAELEQLAAECVREFDSFRAPLAPEDRARRNPEALTRRQCEHLDRWGYPYVMQDFRFHMTLTGRLDVARRAPVLTMLRDRFSMLGLTRLAIDAVAVFRQDAADSRFRTLGLWKLCDSKPLDRALIVFQRNSVRAK